MCEQNYISLAFVKVKGLRDDPESFPFILRMKEPLMIQSH
jgi:hypothetical protein